MSSGNNKSELDLGLAVAVDRILMDFALNQLSGEDCRRERAKLEAYLFYQSLSIMKKETEPTRAYLIRLIEGGDLK